jgi:hypothetical protein
MLFLVGLFAFTTQVPGPRVASAMAMSSAECPVGMADGALAGG